MLDLNVIVLTFNEEKHIQRCICSLASVAQKIIVVDSFSTDQTVEIALSLGAEVVQRKFINQADQFQWAIENCGVKSQWLMRIDADEYLETELSAEIQNKLPSIQPDVDGIYIRRKVIFRGQWIRFGGVYPYTVLRVWRVGQGHIEQRWMDEHVVLSANAKTITLKGHVVDDNLKGITSWTDKHNRYASREMAQILIQKYFPGHRDSSLRKMNADPQARKKRLIKEEIYNKLPPGIRPVLYFFYRYILLLGFLDGGNGFFYHFLQGFWYRQLVDIKIMEVESRSQGDKGAIKTILNDDYGIEI
jgi:glycosyltransferase involved in cell wall biosynthesis